MYNCTYYTISELKVGGLDCDRLSQTGGSTFLKTWFNKEYLILKYQCIGKLKIYYKLYLHIYSCFLYVHRHALAYTYGQLLNEALHNFQTRWNLHKIRPSRTAGCPSGVPDDLYLLPELTG